MRYAALALAMIVFASSAEAQLPTVFTCTPDTFKLEPAGDGLRLTGSLEMPTPGYRYEFTDIETRGEDIHATLKLTAPEGMVIQVISPLDIEQEFDAARKLVVKVNRDFNWGEPEIICRQARDVK